MVINTYYMMYGIKYNLLFSDCSLTENIKLVASLRAEISSYQKNNSELKQLNQVLKDEYQALQLAFTKLEERLRKYQVILFIILHLIFFRFQQNRKK